MNYKSIKIPALLILSLTACAPKRDRSIEPNIANPNLREMLTAA